jgi:hypothetical protein
MNAKDSKLIDAPALSRRKSLSLLLGTALAGLMGGATTAAAAAMGRDLQSGWCWCEKCGGLFCGPSGKGGACPAGGRHDGRKSLRIMAVIGGEIPGKRQGKWACCSKCQCMFYDGFRTKGMCPAGGGHSSSGSEPYAIDLGETGLGREGGWRWCKHCYGLHFAGRRNVVSLCPHGGPHESTPSLHFALNHAG